jgi:hypothetical protein
MWDSLARNSSQTATRRAPGSPPVSANSCIGQSPQRQQG